MHSPSHAKTMPDAKIMGKKSQTAGSMEVVNEREGETWEREEDQGL